MRRPAPILAVLLLVAACDTTAPSVHEPEPIVEAYLVAGKPAPPVRLTWSAPIDGTWEAASLGITDAVVRIEELDASNAVLSTIAYAEVPDSAGFYRPVTSPVMKPAGRYRLQADLADGHHLESVTVMPGDFGIVDRNTSAVIYRGSEQFEIELTPSPYPGRQAIYMITIEALDPRPERLTPFFLDIIYEIGPDDPFDPDTLDLNELSDFITGSSPPLNEANYRMEGEATVTTQLPWFTVVFYGPTRIRISAIDDNLYDFLRFQNAQVGGSTLSPGEIPNIRDSVAGGRGVFGSYVPVEAVVEILEPAD